MGSPSTSGAKRRSIKTPRMTEDDPALVALARAGDRAAFDELVRRGADGRRRRADVVVSLDEQREHPSRDRWVQPVDRAERADLRRALAAAIAELPLDQRAALVLRDVEGLSTSEAAGVLGLREPAFKSRLHRARELLRAGLADHTREGGAS